MNRKQFTAVLNNNSTIVSCSRSKMLLLLIITLSHNALGRPQAAEDVKIITNPSPGQEYVAIRNVKPVIPLRRSKELDGDDDDKGEYMGVCAEAIEVLQKIVFFTSTTIYWISAVLEYGSMSLGERCLTLRDEVVLTLPRKVGHESPSDGRRIPEE
jgi:hypothetical protein